MSRPPARTIASVPCLLGHWILVPCVVLAAVVALGAAIASAAVAAPPDGAWTTERPATAPEISSTGSCPSADAIWAAMTTLVPHGALDALPRSASVDVADLGENYRVRLTTGNNQRVRVYRDVARDCEQRARFAAVFVVLTLMPPELLLEAPPRPPPPPAAPAAIVVVAAESPARALRLELAALGDTAPAVLSAPEMTSAGAELRMAMGAGRLAALLGLALQPRADFTLGALRAREQRITLDAGARWRQVGRWIELDGEASLVAALFRAEGLSPVIARQATRVDVGLRAGLVLRFGDRDARVAPIAGLHAVYFPRPYDLAMMPSGVVGRTPSVRLGATAGIAWSF